MLGKERKSEERFVGGAPLLNSGERTRGEYLLIEWGRGGTGRIGLNSLEIWGGEKEFQLLLETITKTRRFDIGFSQPGKNGVLSLLLASLRKL